MTKQNERSFSYNKLNQQVKATNQEGTLTKEYDLYGNLLKTKDPNDNVVTYTYDTYGNKTSMTYANGDKVSYTYDGKDQLLDVRKAGRIVAKYQYDLRGNVTELIQDNVTTNYSYDNANRTTRYLSKKDGVVISDRQYQFDKNGNVLKEIADGKANTFTYNENDELKTSSKFINNKQVQTTYAYDMYGNRVEKKDDGTYKKSVYNDKNQLKQIDSEKGTTYLHYDDIGNITSIYYEDGFIEKYSYDDFGQLTQIKNNEDKVLTYHYDALGERIDEKLSDTAIYESKSYYTTEEDLDLSELRDQLSDENIEETFEALKRQAKVKADNGNSCTLTTTHYKLANYQKEDQYHEYVLDYAAEYSQVLMKDAEASVYGVSRLETEDTKYIVGWNDTVNQTIQDNEVTSLDYDDYGYSDDIDTGFGYNGEQSDIAGLIYLRARYYNPKLGRFIQIDPYKGEDTSLESKNRYTFVYNNPYKYVDQSGNFPIPKINIGTPRVATGFNAGLTSLIENAKNMMNTAANALRSVFNAVADPTPTTVIEAVGNITNFVDTVKETYLPPPPQPCPPKPLAEKSFHEMSEAERRQWATKTDKYGEKINNPYASSTSFLTWLDSVLDPLLKAGAYVVVGLGVISLAAAAIVCSPAVAAGSVAGTTLGAIAGATGTVAIYGGTGVVAGSGVEILSGVTGYRLDGERLSEEEAKQRILSGQYNAATAYLGMNAAYAGLVISTATATSKPNQNDTEGASGADESIGTADFYVGPDGTVTRSLDAYSDYIEMKGWTKDQIVNQIINGERIGSGLKDDVYHRSASFLSKEQLMNGSTTVFGGRDTFPYIKLETPGILNDKKGIFEYIINKKGQVTHQLFKPD